MRSVILDSVLPPDTNFDEVASSNLLRSLSLVFDGCAVDRQCSAAYPDLRRRFAELVARADREPLKLILDADVRGAQVVDAIYGALHDTQLIPHLPRLISAAGAGNYDELTPLVKNNRGPSSSSYGMRYSVWCGEEMPFQDPARINAQLPPAKRARKTPLGDCAAEQ